MTEQLLEVATITSNPEPPTFENTIEALERSGQLLSRVATVHFSLSSSDSTPYLEELESEIAPLLSAHNDRIALDSVLYSRIRSLTDRIDELALTPEQHRLLQRTELQFRLQGAALDELGKERLAEVNQRLASLSTEFDQNLLADTNDLAVVVRDLQDLEGLGEAEIDAAAAAADDRGLTGSWLITLPLFTGHPWLANLRNRDLRERIYRASLARGSRANAWDNSEIVLQVTRLRAERAHLLGFDSHAAATAANSTAGSVEAIQERMSRLIPAAVHNAKVERDELQSLFDADRDAAGLGREPLAAWDWAFYAEQLRAREHDVDASALRPYFESERVLQEGLFFAAQREFGLTFTERTDIPAHNPEARVFEVHDADGTLLGLFVIDLYTRDSKRGGAWMDSYVEQSELLGEPTAVVVNNLNVPKPPAGTPTLLTFDEVETLFHEFGHALHGLLAHVRYPHFSGTSVLRDFVEYPSQVNEMWVLDPVVLAHYARHVDTGAPLDPALAERLIDSASFGQGFSTTEYLAATMLDLAWHSRIDGDTVADVRAFEAGALDALGLDLPQIPPRYSSCYFQHVFAGGYAAGYYGYIWSEMFDADTVEWFREGEASGQRDVRASGERFRRAILQPGGSRDPLKMIADLFGRPARIEPLLARRGLEG